MRRLIIATGILLFLICGASKQTAKAQTAVSIAPTPRIQFFCDGGAVPCAGGKLFSYQSGTSTPQATYADFSGNYPNTNPVILDSTGSAQVWLASGQIYRLVLQDANGSQQWLVDGIQGPPNLLAPGPIGTTTPNVVEATEFLTASPLPALSGIVRLASADQLCWRNNANSADTCISKDSGDSFNLSILEKMVFADQQVGATADVKITNCLAKVNNGGTCDARGFGATTQSLTATITVNSNQTLLFDPATKFQASTTALNLFTVEPDGIVRSFTFDCTNQPSYTGILFQTDPTKPYVDGVGGEQSTEISNIATTPACATVTGYSGLKVNSTSSSTGVSFLKIHGWRMWGGSDGAIFTSATSGFVNSIQMYDMGWTGTHVGWHMTDGGAQLTGDKCFGCYFQELHSTDTGVLLDGSSGTVEGNEFYGNIYDTTSPITVTDTAAVKNTFEGRFDGAVSDVDLANNFFYLSNAVANLPAFTVRGAQIKTGASVGDQLDIFDFGGGSNPHKYLRTSSGHLQVSNSAFNATILDLSDAGLATIPSVIDSALTVSLPVCTDGSKTLTSACTGLPGIANGGTTTSAGTCPTSTSAYATCSVIVPLARTEPDTSYNASCSVASVSAGDPWVKNISKNVSQITVTISNLSGANATASTPGEVDCTTTR